VSASHYCFNDAAAIPYYHSYPASAVREGVSAAVFFLVFVHDMTIKKIKKDKASAQHSLRIT